MTWIDAVERAPDLRRARKVLNRVPSKEEGQAFFEAVRNLLGQDYERACSLASKWRLLSNSNETMAWALRTKAVHEKLNGRWLASANSFISSATYTESDQDRLIFQIGAIDCLGKLGRVKQAANLSHQLATGLKRLGCTPEAGAALLNGGNALLWHDQYKEAQKTYSQAKRLLAGDHDSPYLPAVLIGLSTAELYGGHPRKAIEYAIQAEQAFESRSDNQHGLLAKQNRAIAALLLGDLDGALSLLLEIRENYSTNSLDRIRIEELLGDVYFKMSLYQESLDAYSAAISNSRIKASLLNLGNCLLGQGSASLELADFKEAERQLRRAKVVFRRFGNPIWEAHSQSKLGKLYLLQGRLTDAKKGLRSAIATLSLAKASSLLAEAQLDLCDCFVAEGKNPTILANSTLKILKRTHHLQSIWRVHYVLAQSSTGSKRLQNYRKMMQAIWSSRSLASSLVSRASFLTDKSVAISKYMGELLASGKPSYIEEARTVIRESRSIALLEEILAATNAPADVVDRIESLREELNLAINNDANSSNTRQAYYSSTEISKLQRKWIEATSQIQSAHFKHTDQRLWPDIVLVDAGNKSYSLNRGSVYVHRKNVRELAEELAWFRFELLEPMANRDCSHVRAMESLETLANSVWMPADSGNEDIISICPEGSYWQIPWQLMAVTKSDCEAVLCVGPWANRSQDTIPANPKAMIWFHDTPELPNIAKEAKSFLEKFQGARVCQTIEEVRESLKEDSYDLLHVASHANFHHTNPMFSSLSFQGGKITAAEISRAQLNVKHVILSACETGTVAFQNRVEPEGLVRSFLARGAKSILASSWPLDDQMAEKFMYNFYNALLDGCPMSRSVSIARSEVRKQRPHPYYWGSFALFGGYSS